jgi:uncharacterized protein
VSRNRLALLTAYLTGLLFGLGLVLGGMTQPAKVVGFLDVTGAWDPSLAFVMAGAVGMHALFYRRVLRMRSPLLGGSFGLPTRRDITSRLVFGSALFGLGWGLAGFCPGPGLVSSATGSTSALLFVATMLGGMALYEPFERWLDVLAARRRQRAALEEPAAWTPPPKVTG